MEKTLSWILHSDRQFTTLPFTIFHALTSFFLPMGVSLGLFPAGTETVSGVEDFFREG